MKQKKIYDERTMQLRQKINSDALALLLYVLLAAIVVQQFVFGAPFVQYVGEFLCFLGASFYIVVRNLLIGIDVYDNRKNAKQMVFIQSAVTAIVITVVIGVMNYTRYADKFAGNTGEFILTLVVTGATAGVTVLGINYLLYAINKKRQAAIEKQCDED